MQLWVKFLDHRNEQTFFYLFFEKGVLGKGAGVEIMAKNSNQQQRNDKLGEIKARATQTENIHQELINPPSRTFQNSHEIIRILEKYVILLDKVKESQLINRFL